LILRRWVEAGIEIAFQAFRTIARSRQKKITEVAAEVLE